MLLLIKYNMIEKVINCTCKQKCLCSFKIIVDFTQFYHASTYNVVTRYINDSDNNKYGIYFMCSVVICLCASKHVQQVFDLI